MTNSSTHTLSDRLRQGRERRESVTWICPRQCGRVRSRGVCGAPRLSRATWRDPGFRAAHGSAPGPPIPHARKGVNIVGIVSCTRRSLAVAGVIAARTATPRRTRSGRAGGSPTTASRPTRGRRRARARADTANHARPVLASATLPHGARLHPGEQSVASLAHRRHVRSLPQSGATALPPGDLDLRPPQRGLVLGGKRLVVVATRRYPPPRARVTTRLPVEYPRLPVPCGLAGWRKTKGGRWLTAGCPAMRVPI